jgi:hypothetical protein
MKKLFTIILIIFGGSLAAQITVNSSDMPSTGDTIRTSITVADGTYDFTRTGNNYVWNFEALAPVTQRVDTFLSVTQTPISFWPFFITSANLVTKFNPANVLPGLPALEAYNFFNNTSGSYKDVGYGLVISGIALPLKYNSADMIYKFPMTNGTSHESASGLELAIPDMGYLLIDRNRSSVVDGWGTLTTPYGTFDVLRLKSTVSEYDSIYIDSLQQGIPVQRDYIQYQWIGKNFGLPLLSVTEDATFGSTVVYIDSVRDVNVGLAESRFAGKCSIIPNPVTNILRFNLDSKSSGMVHISVFDLSGRCFLNQSMQHHSGETIEIQLDNYSSRLVPGSYIIVAEINQQYYSGRFIKQ